MTPDQIRDDDDQRLADYYAAIAGRDRRDDISADQLQRMQAARDALRVSRIVTSAAQRSRRFASLKRRRAQNAIIAVYVTGRAPTTP